MTILRSPSMLTPEEKMAIIDDYKSGMKTDDIIKKHYLSNIGSLYFTLSQCKVTLDRNKSHKPKESPKSKEEKCLAIRDDYDSGMRVVDILRKYHLTSNISIYHALRSVGYTKRRNPEFAPKKKRGYAAPSKSKARQKPVPKPKREPVTEPEMLQYGSYEMTREQAELAVSMYKAGKPIGKILKATGISSSALYVVLDAHEVKRRVLRASKKYEVPASSARLKELLKPPPKRWYHKAWQGFKRFWIGDAQREEGLL